MPVEPVYTPILISESNIERYYKSNQLVLLLKLTGLYYGERKNRVFWYCFGILRAAFLIILSRFLKKTKKLVKKCFRCFYNFSFNILSFLQEKL